MCRFKTSKERHLLWTTKRFGRVSRRALVFGPQRERRFVVSKDESKTAAKRVVPVFQFSLTSLLCLRLTDVRFAHRQRGVRGVLRVFRRAMSHGHGFRVYSLPKPNRKQTFSRFDCGRKFRNVPRTRSYSPCLATLACEESSCLISLIK